MQAFAVLGARAASSSNTDHASDTGKTLLLLALLRSVDGVVRHLVIRELDLLSGGRSVPATQTSPCPSTTSAQGAGPSCATSDTISA